MNLSMIILWTHTFMVLTAAIIKHFFHGGWWYIFPMIVVAYIIFRFGKRYDLQLRHHKLSVDHDRQKLDALSTALTKYTTSTFGLTSELVNLRNYRWVKVSEGYPPPTYDPDYLVDDGEKITLCGFKEKDAGIWPDVKQWRYAPQPNRDV